MDDTFAPDKLTFYGGILLAAVAFVVAFAQLALSLLRARKARSTAYLQQRLAAYTLTVAAEAAIQAGVRQFRLVRGEAAEAGLAHILPLLDPLIEQQMSALAKLQATQTELSKDLPEGEKIRREDEVALEDDLVEIQEWTNLALRQQRNGALLDEIRADILRRKKSGEPKPALRQQR